MVLNANLTLKRVLLIIVLTMISTDMCKSFYNLKCTLRKFVNENKKYDFIS